MIKERTNISKDKLERIPKETQTSRVNKTISSREFFPDFCVISGNAGIITWIFPRKQKRDTPPETHFLPKGSRTVSERKSTHKKQKILGNEISLWNAIIVFVDRYNAESARSWSTEERQQLKELAKRWCNAIPVERGVLGGAVNGRGYRSLKRGYVVDITQSIEDTHVTVNVDVSSWFLQHPRQTQVSLLS